MASVTRCTRSWADMAEDSEEELSDVPVEKSDSELEPEPEPEPEPESTTSESIASVLEIAVQDPTFLQPKPQEVLAKFDPELDSSRDGLPLMIKQSSLTIVAKRETVTENKDIGTKGAWERPLFSRPQETKKRVRENVSIKTKETTQSPSKSHEWSSIRSQALIQQIVGSNSTTPTQPLTPLTPTKPTKKQRKGEDGDDTEEDLVIDTSLPASTTTSPRHSPPTSPKSLSTTSSQAEETGEEGGEEGGEGGEGEKKKGLPPKLLTPEERLKQRQKQIDLGKKTQGYQRFNELVPRNKRKPWHPKTPDRNKVCSKRSWDGMVRKWRRMLHRYDPPALRREAKEHGIPTRAPSSTSSTSSTPIPTLSPPTVSLSLPPPPPPLVIALQSSETRSSS